MSKQAIEDNLRNFLRFARIDPDEFLDTPLADFDKDFYKGEITIKHEPIGGVELHINVTYHRPGRKIPLVGE